MLNWATARGYRTGENPAQWRGRLEHSFPKKSRVRQVEHHAAMPYVEIPPFLAELRQVDSVIARGLEFTILTAARAGEVIGARWSEFDLENRVWTVPANRIKSGREHRVPLSDRAVEIVRQMVAVMHSDFVFPGAGSRGISKTGFFDLLRQIGAKVTTHGFRSTFRDWASERTSYPHAVLELSLAHQVGTAVERAYARSDLFDRRRRLMDEWARFCTGGSTGEVVPLRAG